MSRIAFKSEMRECDCCGETALQEVRVRKTDSILIGKDATPTYFSFYIFCNECHCQYTTPDLTDANQLLFISAVGENHWKC